MHSAPVPGKVCIDCRCEKPYAEFSAQTSAKDGHRPYCRSCVRVRNSAWYQANKSRTRELDRQWRERNPERAAELSAARWAKWQSKPGNREKERANAAARMRNPARRLARQVWGVLRGQKGGRRWSDLIGYSEADLRSHLERQFLPGMSWANYGKWHIDHIVPLTSFTIAGPDDPELRRAWALTNLRPLWAKDNIRKGARMETLL